MDEKAKKYRQLMHHLQQQKQNRENLTIIDQEVPEERPGSNLWSKQSHPDEEIFGVLLLICGLAAAVANFFILIIALKHLRSRNVLFIIITNFALIDEFKALCAIYMGAAQLLSSTSYTSDQQVSVYKMLQTSVFIFYFGNICSVLNLVLAVTNEFLYIKLPLQYTKFVKKRRVVLAVVSIWLAGLAFSLSKALHGGSNEAGAQIWISSNNEDNNNSTVITKPDNSGGNQTKPAYRRQNGTVSTDIYALILVSVLLFCLFIVGAVYLSLYRTIREATAFSTKESIKSRSSNCSAPDNHHSPTRHSFNKRKKRQRTKFSKRFLNRMSVESIYHPPNSNDNHQQFQNSTKMCNVETLMTCGTTIETAKSTQNNAAANTHKSVAITSSASISTTNALLPSHCKHRRRDSRLFKRHKCIIVILSVCCLYLIYLSCYFALQLFHVIHIVQGIDPKKLRERYIINFVLRLLFVLHASLNPLIFFRIQTFRYSFIRFCNSNVLICCNVTIGRNTARNSGLSFVDISTPVVVDY